MINALVYICPLLFINELKGVEVMQPVDMVGFLISKGYSESRIAEFVGTSQPTIHRIKRGSGTTYEIGKRIENLYLGESANKGDSLESGTDCENNKRVG